MTVLLEINHKCHTFRKIPKIFTWFLVELCRRSIGNDVSQYFWLSETNVRMKTTVLKRTETKMGK